MSFEQTIEMSTKKVTESDVVRFLHDMGLSHLYRSGNGIQMMMAAKGDAK